MVRAGLASDPTDPTDPTGRTVAGRTMGRTAGRTRTIWEALEWAGALPAQWATTEAGRAGQADQLVRADRGGTTWEARVVRVRVVEARQDHTCTGTAGPGSDPTDRMDRTDLIPTVLVVRTAPTRTEWEGRSEAEAPLTL